MPCTQKSRGGAASPLAHPSVIDNASRYNSRSALKDQRPPTGSVEDAVFSYDTTAQKNILWHKFCYPCQNRSAPGASEMTTHFFHPNVPDGAIPFTTSCLSFLTPSVVSPHPVGYHTRYGDLECCIDRSVQVWMSPISSLVSSPICSWRIPPMARSSSRPQARRAQSTSNLDVHPASTGSAMRDLPPASGPTLSKAFKSPRLTAQTSSIKQPAPYACREVKQLRESLGASQTVFAELLGVSKSLVEHWESGVRVPSLIARRLMDSIRADPELFLRTLTCQLASGKAIGVSHV
jgi:DNA-binding transcriptional regulator YiaG